MLCASVYGRKEASSQDSIHIISYFSLKCYDKIALFCVKLPYRNISLQPGRGR